jgi:hypothetical protein
VLTLPRGVGNVACGGDEIFEAQRWVSVAANAIERVGGGKN